MCLHVTNCCFPKIAKNDIYCFKLVKYTKDSDSHKILTTPYQRMVVEIGEEYKTKIKTTRSFFSLRKFHVNEGFHSFKYEIDAEEERLYHMNMNMNLNEIMVVCMIPKGSLYYTGTFSTYENYALSTYENYVSNKIKYVEIIS